MSNATCLIRPRSLYARLVVRRITINVLCDLSRLKNTCVRQVEFIEWFPLKGTQAVSLPWETLERIGRNGFACDRHCGNLAGSCMPRRTFDICSTPWYFSFSYIPCWDSLHPSCGRCGVNLRKRRNQKKCCHKVSEEALGEEISCAAARRAIQ